MDTNDAGNRDDGQRDGRHVERQMGPLINVGNFGTRQEAEIARGVLQENGIPAFVQGGEMATTMYFVGTALGGVVLQSPESRAGEARRILADEFGSGDSFPAWKCPKCSADVDAGFEICWQCSTPHPGDTINDIPATPSAAKKPAANASGDSFDLDEDSGEIEPTCTSDSEHDYPGDEILDRALRAAAFGIVVIPLSFYAMFLLVDACNAKRSHASRWKLILAHILAYLPIVTYLGAVLFGIIARLWH